MQNDRMVKAKLFCQKLLSIKSTIRSRQSKTWFVGNVNLNNLLYDHFKHSFESIRVKGTELGTKTFFVGNLFKNFTINECIVFTFKLCRRRPFGCDLLNSDNWRLDNSYYRPREKKKRKDKVNHGSFHVFITFLFDTKTK